MAATLDDVITELRRGLGREKPQHHTYTPFTLTVSMLQAISTTQTKISDVINSSLAYWARAVIVDNLTNQWLFIPDAARFVAPYTTGKVIPLYGTQVANIVFQTPVGIVQSPPILGQQVIAVYTNEGLGPSDGSHLAAPAQTSLGSQSFTTGGVAAQVTFTFPVPTGTRSVYFTVDQPGKISTVMKVVGGTTGNVYAVALPRAIITASILSAADTTVQLTLSAVAANTTINATGFIAEDVQQTIIHDGDFSAPIWEAPNQAGGGFVVSLPAVANATATIIAGNATQSTSIFQLAFTQGVTAANTAVQLLTTDLAFDLYEFDMGNFTAWTLNFNGLLLQPNIGLLLRTNGFTATTLRGGVSFGVG